jgi:hypothetical protein
MSYWELIKNIKDSWSGRVWGAAGLFILFLSEYPDIQNVSFGLKIYRILPVFAIALLLVLWRRVKNKHTNFTIIESTLEHLKAKGLPAEFLKSLESIKDREIYGKEVFLECFKELIGENRAALFNQYKSVAVKHSLKQRPALPDKKNRTQILLWKRIHPEKFYLAALFPILIAWAFGWYFGEWHISEFSDHGNQLGIFVAKVDGASSDSPQKEIVQEIQAILFAMNKEDKDLVVVRPLNRNLTGYSSDVIQNRFGRTNAAYIIWGRKDGAEIKYSFITLPQNLPRNRYFSIPELLRKNFLTFNEPELKDSYLPALINFLGGYIHFSIHNCSAGDQECLWEKYKLAGSNFEKALTANSPDAGNEIIIRSYLAAAIFFQSFYVKNPAEKQNLLRKAQKEYEQCEKWYKHPDRDIDMKRDIELARTLMNMGQILRCRLNKPYSQSGLDSVATMYQEAAGLLEKYLDYEGFPGPEWLMLLVNRFNIADINEMSLQGQPNTIDKVLAPYRKIFQEYELVPDSVTEDSAFARNSEAILSKSFNRIRNLWSQVLKASPSVTVLNNALSDYSRAFAFYENDLQRYKEDYTDANIEFGDFHNLISDSVANRCHYWHKALEHYQKAKEQGPSSYQVIIRQRINLITGKLHQAECT